MISRLESDDAQRLADCVAGGGLAVFPTDTVYGVCCDPENQRAARRMYELKGRPPARSSAIMFFALEPALQALGELPEAERLALQALLPGPVTVLLANRERRYAAACRSDPATLGLRVPRLSEGLAALGAVERPVMQSSANMSGEPDSRSVAVRSGPSGCRPAASNCTVCKLHGHDDRHPWNPDRHTSAPLPAGRGPAPRRCAAACRSSG